jgi:hypothetical protein
MTGRFRGRYIRTVELTAAFPITPNYCPFLPPANHYAENLTLTYPGANGPYRFRPSYATAYVNPGRFWYFNSVLVGGSFATTGALAQFRPVLDVGACSANNSGNVALMTLGNSNNYLRNF